jgi:hypothetical protein
MSANKKNEFGLLAARDDLGNLMENDSPVATQSFIAHLEVLNFIEHPKFLEG